MGFGYSLALRATSVHFDPVIGGIADCQVIRGQDNTKSNRSNHQIDMTTSRTHRWWCLDDYCVGAYVVVNIRGWDCRDGVAIVERFAFVYPRIIPIGLGLGPAVTNSGRAQCCRTRVVSTARCPSKSLPRRTTCKPPTMTPFPFTPNYCPKPHQPYIPHSLPSA